MAHSGKPSSPDKLEDSDDNEEADNADYDEIKAGDILEIKGVRKTLEDNTPITIRNITQNFDIKTSYDFSERERQILLAGGKLSYTVASS